MINTGVAFLKQLLSGIIAMVMFIVGIASPALKPFEPKPEQPEIKEECEMLTLDGYSIVVSSDSTDYERKAAEILQDYFTQISGITLPIKSDSEPAEDNEILIGSTNRYSYELSDYANDSFIIRTIGTRLAILGKGSRGVLYGVYNLLENYFDCHWYTRSLIVVPTADSLEIPKEINHSESPYFEYRETDWISPTDVTYSVANQLNGGVYRRPSDELGSSVNYIGSFCHTLSAHICKYSVYFDSHPEYYAYREDKDARVTKQLCLTNPDVVRIVTDEVLELLRLNYRPEMGLQIVSLTQDDNQEYCQCDKCKALDEQNGSHAGTMITFVNQVAKSVADAGYDNVAIDTFAYQYTRKTPTNVKPLDNVIVRLCSIECCFAHPLNDINCKLNVDFMADLKGWGEICDRVYIWDYTTNYANYLGPFCNFGVIQSNMQTFAENSVKGVYEEGNYSAAESDGEFAELRAYLLSKLMWNPYLDYDKEMNSFLKAYYGAGWQYVREFIDMTVRNTGTKKTHMGIYQNMTSLGVLDLTNSEIKYCNDLWENAKKLAENDWQKKNVERSELCWRYWKACNRVDEFSKLRQKDDRLAESEKLFNDYKEFGIRRIHEGFEPGVGILTDTPDFDKTPREWTVK